MVKEFQKKLRLFGKFYTSMVTGGPLDPKASFEKIFSAFVRSLVLRGKKLNQLIFDSLI